MIYKSVVTALAFSLLIFLIIPGAQAQAAGETHTVQQGETLFSISRTYDVTVGDIRRWNRLQSDALIPWPKIACGPASR